MSFRSSATQQQVMARYTWIVRSIVPIALIVFTAIAGASSAGERRRHRDIDGVSREWSAHGRHATARGGHSFKPSTGKSNEIIVQPGKKVSHRLIGGHLRADRPPALRGETDTLWDDGFLLSSAGNGKERKTGVRNGDDDDDKKSLSQQVKEGKYGLIQNEIYPDGSKRPGIISYHGNPEVPADTAANLGGLDEDEIWLAENHVLVLRGGKFPEHDPQHEGTSETDRPWKPIDNYQAPRRQVKIPSRPKVPPPFPVQLADGEPIRIIGPNGTTEIDNGTVDYDGNNFYRKGVFPGEGPFFAIAPNGTLVSSNGFEEPGNLSSNRENKEKFGPPPGIPNSVYRGLPPGAVFVPPPTNQTDYDDEDQSIYYPPPYSFHFQQENSTAIPPGPLVPGIILPPPPDFFAPLDEKKSTTKKHGKRPATSSAPLPRARPTYLPPRKLTTKYQKMSTPVTVTTERNSCRNSSCSFRFPTRNYPKSVAYLGVTTTPATVETTTASPEFYTINPVVGNQVVETSTEEKNRWNGLVNGKVPVLAYYPTTTTSSVERPIEVTPASIKNILSGSHHPSRIPSQASYYFYEESNENTESTRVNSSPVYYRSTTMSPFYKVELHSAPEERRNEFYKVDNVPSEETTKDYNVKVINSIVKEPQSFYSDSPVTPKTSKYKVGSTRAQSQRMLADQRPVYYEPISDLPPIAIETFQTTLKPQPFYKDTQTESQLDYRQEKKSQPIYQYSFEATDYVRDDARRPYRYQTTQEQRQTVYNNYNNGQTESVQYIQDNGQIVRKHRLRPQTIYKPRQSFVDPTSTTMTPSDTIIHTTENPQHAYFTQQDERLLDDVTKEYFTMFGKKLNGKTWPSTTPLYAKSTVTEKPGYSKNQESFNTYQTNDYNYENNRHGIYKLPNVNVQYGDLPKQRPFSLKDDTLVNYKDPLPPINPDSEFIAIVDSKQPLDEQHQQPLSNYGLQPVTPIANRPEDFAFQRGRQNGKLQPIGVYENSQEFQGQSEKPLNDFLPIDDPRIEQFRSRPPSLVDDVAVNYRDPPPTINPDAEFIDPALVQGNRPDKAGYFAYRLPGDAGHFYFLTPQAIAQRQEQQGNYLYPKPRGSRLLRRIRGPANV